MSHSQWNRIAGCGLAATAILLTGLPGLASDASAAMPESGQGKSAVPTVVAHMSDAGIHLSTGHKLRAGTVKFKVVATDHGHALQLLRLHKGYTFKQAQSDIQKAFGGDLDAIRRVDHRITWLGGAPARPQHPGQFAVKLPAGDWLLTDQNGPSVFRLHVFGKPADRPPVRSQGRITAFSYGFGTAPSKLPNAAWTRVNNVSDQPHFVVFQRVKQRTTGHMVRSFLKHHGLQGNPRWALKASTDTGVISPNRAEVFHYQLPAGKYLLACFWPDDDTGMPHILMGMWKLVQLKK